MVGSKLIGVADPDETKRRLSRIEAAFDTTPSPSRMREWQGPRARDSGAVADYERELSGRIDDVVRAVLQLRQNVARVVGIAQKAVDDIVENEQEIASSLAGLNAGLNTTMPRREG